MSIAGYFWRKLRHNKINLCILRLILMEKKSYPLVIAHKGSSEEAYENSMESFNLAVVQKADMIELDTHLTSDGNFIIYHDRRIKYENKKYLISKTPLKTIEEFQLPNGEEIPTLEDVLNKLLPKIQINIEIKCKTSKKIFDNFLKGVEVDNSKILVSSFRSDVINELKSSTLGYKLAYIYRFPTPKIRRIADKEYIHSLNADYRFLSSNAVQQYHKKNKEVYTWTVNEELQIRKFVKMGVDGIFTDNPLKTKKIIETVR